MWLKVKSKKLFCLAEENYGEILRLLQFELYRDIDPKGGIEPLLSAWDELPLSDRFNR